MREPRLLWSDLGGKTVLWCAAFVCRNAFAIRFGHRIVVVMAGAVWHLPPVRGAAIARRILGAGGHFLCLGTGEPTGRGGTAVGGPIMVDQMGADAVAIFPAGCCCCL